MEEENYEEVPTEEYYSEDLTSTDVIFILLCVFILCVAIAFIGKVIRDTFKNIHLKIGDKFDIGVETKEGGEK